MHPINLATISRVRNTQDLYTTHTEQRSLFLTQYVHVGMHITHHVVCSMLTKAVRITTGRKYVCAHAHTHTQGESSNVLDLNWVPLQTQRPTRSL